MITGLKPRGFTWVIANRLAVSERIGGHGFQHRRVRREEEINWLVREAEITDVVTLLAGNQNLAAYEAAGLRTHTVPVGVEPARIDAGPLYETLDRLLNNPKARVLVHREIVDDVVGGLMGGYLIASGLVSDPILASALIQEILGRALGPEGRALIRA
ncbi:MAG: hypothetical protein ACLGHX_03805 [Acidimicrobiia bacterium]